MGMSRVHNDLMHFFLSSHAVLFVSLKRTLVLRWIFFDELIKLTFACAKLQSQLPIIFPTS